MTAKDNEGNKGEVTDTTKVTIYCQIYVSWMFDEGNWRYSRGDTARCLMRVAVG